QFDPIRSPAPAQDLILRHRVSGYRVGDLDRSYPDLELDEDMLYAYGIVTRRLRRLLHPRVYPHHPSGRYLPQGLAKEVLGFLRGRGPTRPRAVHERFGRERVTNGWGGHSNATTLILEQLSYHGFLRVAGREGGIRIYESAPPLGRPLPLERRLP